MTSNQTSDISNKINNILTEYLVKYNTEELHLAADSLDAIEITMALEEEFVIEISDDEIEKIKTVQDIISLVGEKL